MKIGGFLTFFLYFFVFMDISTALKEDETEYQEGPVHIVVPRSIRIFSKGPHPEDPRYVGLRIGKHLHNVVRGGTVGVEFNVNEGLGKFVPAWNKIRWAFLPQYSRKDKSELKPADDSDDSEELLDPVGRGLIDPRRLRPSANELEWEEVPKKDL